MMRLGVEDRAFLRLVERKGAKNLKVARLDSWETPATSYPLRTEGTARIVRKPYSKGTYNCFGAGGFDLFEARKPLPVTGLQRRTKGGAHQGRPEGAEDHRRCHAEGRRASHRRVVVEPETQARPRRKKVGN